MWQCPKCKREFKNKNQNHICTEILTIDAYIVAQEQAVQPILHKIRKVIRAQAPLAKEKISWQMPTFWQKENLIHFAAAKNHIGIYPGPDAIIAFTDRLTSYKTSKGAIQLLYHQEMPYELIAEITKWRVAQVEK